MTRQITPITETVDSLLENLRTTYTAAVSTLDSERTALTGEAQSLQTFVSESRRLLPAKARVAQHEADVLTLAGRHEEAAEKIAEAEEAARAPERMEQRQQEISTRIRQIDAERVRILRREFYPWFEEFRKPHIEQQRAAVDSLDAGWEGLVDFIREVEIGKEPNSPSLITARLQSDLVARETGEEKALLTRLQQWFGPPAPNPYQRGTGGTA